MVLDELARPRRCGAVQPRARESKGKDRVLLIEADTERRARLATALAASGLTVIAVASIAEIERWPEGEVVVTDGERFTPWWMQVGARHVVVLADTAQQGVDACRRGASAWLPRSCSPDLLIGTIRQLTH
jgi:DNA-binding NtrC family response regulator